MFWCGMKEPGDSAGLIFIIAVLAAKRKIIRLVCICDGLSVILHPEFMNETNLVHTNIPIFYCVLHSFYQFK